MRAIVCLLAVCASTPVVGVATVHSHSRGHHTGRTKKFLSRKQSSLRSNATAHLKSMSALYPYYHTTDDIHSQLKQLATRCQGMTLQQIEETGVSGRKQSIYVVSIRGSGDNQPVNKNFLLFGEHSRELISAESGLHFVKSLCGETDLADKAKSVLQDSEFMIVVNGNPGSRSKVEEGDFCLRTDPSGVDLNRNWDEQWQPAAVLDPADTNPGPEPFSEPETRVFKRLVENYKPTTFLTIHSGTKGMYMPWAYDMDHLANRNEPQMMQILKDLDKDHCQCPFGAAGREVGYSCPGTCLDWVYDKLKTPYAFAFEIYVGADEASLLRERWEEKMQNPDSALIQRNSSLAHSHFRNLFTNHPSNFVQLRAEHHRARHVDRSAEDCFAQFNPASEEEFKQVVDNWSSTYLDMANMVVGRLRQTAKATV